VKNVDNIQLHTLIHIFTKCLNTDRAGAVKHHMQEVTDYEKCPSSICCL